MDMHCPIKIFNNVPLLREVRLTGEVPLSFVSLPWQQLTKFTGELYTPWECLKALRLMPNLTECAFSALEDNLPQDVVSHPNIQHFTLFDGSYRTSSAQLIETLTLPALVTLEIRDLEDLDEEGLNGFLSRSSPPLRKLVVRPLDLEDREGVDLQFSSLWKMPSLTELEIWYPSSGFLKIFFRLPTRQFITPATETVLHELCSCKRWGVRVQYTASGGRTHNCPKKRRQGMRTAAVVPCGVEMALGVCRLSRAPSSAVQKVEILGHGHSHRNSQRIGY
ncbi:hypothetical protein B0H19DRAFT_1147734 [Mycena capillaripes]|nr:hypothetical protein B0H19DRAFT_1147734 [Mycena capillaripes]